MASATAQFSPVYGTQPSGLATPRFAPPSTPGKTPLGDFPRKRHQSPSKAVRYWRTVQPGELGDIISNPAITPLQKALASRVAKAAQKLRQWCEEMEQWAWTGSFEVQSEEVDEREDCLDTINRELAQMDVDELKERVLGIHMNRSRPPSSHSLQSASALRFMDDYELFVTQTLIQALPHLALLNQFLRAWSLRVLVLRQVPIFLSQLKSCRQHLSAGFSASREPVGSAAPPHRLDLLRNKIKAAQNEAETTTRDAGKRLDAMLDILEGSDDCLPDAWIDDYENLESEYGKLSAEAEARLLQIEVLKQRSVAEETEHVIDLDSLTPTPSPTLWTTRKSSLGNETCTSESGDATSVSSLIEGITGARPELIKTEEPGSDRMAIADAPDLIPSSSEQAPPVAPPESAQIDCIGEQQNGTAPVPIQDNERLSYEDDANFGDTEDISMIRRASVQSISSFQRSQIKTLNVRRSSSRASSSTTQSHVSIEQNSSPPVSPVSPINVSKRESWFTQATSPLVMTIENASNEPGNRSSMTPVTIQEADDEKLEDSKFGTEDDPVATPERDIRRNPSFTSSPFAEQSDASSALEDSPSASRPLAKAPRPPLNSMIPKRRMRDSNTSPIDSSIPSSPPDPSSAPQTPLSPSKAAKSPTSSRIPLQQQISAIISEIHAPIRLASSPTTDAPSTTATPAPTATPPQKPAKYHRFHSLRTHLHNPRVVTTPPPSLLPTLTLAPASAAEAKRAGATDPEIKLYHLHGREGKPIKLFVRRIGENGERVMVRVGGGWADLSEYLRVYVEHHGSAAKRAVSEGKVAVFGLGDGSGAPDGKTGAHGRKGSFSESSPLAKFEGPEFGDGPASSPISGVEVATSSPVVDEAASGVGSEASSRKVSAASHWNEGGRSLAGPAARKTEMSDEKRDWVEGIVEQARKLHISGAGGKKGGAKRVFLKGRE